MEVDHKQIREALDKATPGPWKVFRDKSKGETLIGTAYDHPQLKASDSIVGHAYGKNGEFVYIRDYDAYLIANAPEWLRQLLDENERLKQIRYNATEAHITIQSRQAEEIERLKAEKAEAIEVLKLIFADETDENGWLDDNTPKDIVSKARTVLERLQSEEAK